MKISVFHYRGLAWVYVISVLLVTILPLNSTSVSLSGSSVLSFKTEHILHALAYLPAVFIFYEVLIAAKHRFKFAKLFSVLSALLFAFITEGIQYFLSYRAFSPNDLMANFIGVLIGSLVLFFFFKIKQARYSSLDGS
jgi:VanZ family protein